MQHVRLQVGEHADKGRHGQTVPKRKAEQVAFVVQKHLGFVHQPPKRGGVNNAITVALKIVARGRWHFSVAPTTRLFGVTGVGFKHSSDR